jgi:hypothetical protein
MESPTVPCAPSQIVFRRCSNSGSTPLLVTAAGAIAGSGGDGALLQAAKNADMSNKAQINV